MESNDGIDPRFVTHSSNKNVISISKVLRPINSQIFLKNE